MSNRNTTNTRFLTNYHPEIHVPTLSKPSATKAQGKRKRRAFRLKDGKYQRRLFDFTEGNFYRYPECPVLNAQHELPSRVIATTARNNDGMSYLH